jgi:hypothetical protein
MTGWHKAPWVIILDATTRASILSAPGRNAMCPSCQRKQALRSVSEAGGFQQRLCMRMLSQKKKNNL